MEARNPASVGHLKRENEELRAKLAEAEHELALVKNQLAEAQEVLTAIQSGEVDAVLVSGPQGDQIFTLKGAEYAYRALVEAMNEGAATLAVDGTVLYCNQRLSSLLGIPLEQIIGNDVKKLVAVESMHDFEALFAQAWGAEARVAELDFAAHRGTRISVYVSLCVMHSEAGTLCMVVADLTERKKRDELITAGKLATSILESAAEAIAVCDDTGRIVRVNKALEDLRGMNPLYQLFEDAFPLELSLGTNGPGTAFSISSALSGSTLRAREARFRRQDGQSVSLLLTAAPINSSDGIAGCVLTMTDITERKRDEETLLESGRLLALALEAGQSGFFNLDLVSNVSHWSPELERLYGIQPGVFGGSLEQWRQWIVPEDFPVVEGCGREAIRTGELNCEWRIIRQSDGEIRWLSARGRVLRDGSGNPVRLVGINVDITERKRAEEALRKSEERFRMVLEGVKDHAIFMLDRQGLVTTWNAGAQHLKGYTADQILGQHFSRFYLPEDVLAGKPQRELELAALHGQYSEEAWRVRQDGSRFLASMTTTALHDTQGQLLGFTRIVRDVTELRQTEEKLRMATERFQVALKGSSVVVFNQDLDLRYTWIYNASLGYEASEVIGKRDVDIFECAEDAAVTEAIKRDVINSGTSRRQEVLIRWKGEGLYFDLVVEPLRDVGGHIIGVTCAAVDVSARKRAEQLLLRAEETLRRAEKLEVAERLAAVIAHEVNNPLTSVANLLYLLDGKLPPTENQYLQLAQKELSRATQAVTQNLRFHRQQSLPTPARIPALIDSVLANFEGRLRDSEIVVLRQYNPVAALNCWADDLRQVIACVLSNAVDSMRPSGGKLLLRVAEAKGQTTAGQATGIRITIADTGHGMPPEVLKRASEAFFTTKGITGTGLGLWVSQNVIHRHSGTLRIKSSTSEKYRGTVVRIFLPFATDSTLSAETRKQTSH
jgi:PAS domain S-box-containing protein